MVCLVSKVTETVLLKTLGISSLSDILDRTYKGFSREADVDREKVMGVYGDRNRGSIRLNSGRFYTAAEYENRIQRVKALQLP